ncbi:O-antigen ligase family protein [Singulisphaera sp. Ch08]|uniref:O-antigen ligase family protein n=1 Tax=Singulisphaera sp. Ch08 TaxID=3120278 RepID=A0AAU7CPL1_9BACT
MRARADSKFENPWYRYVETHFGAYVLFHVLLALLIRGSALLSTLYFLVFFGVALSLAASRRVEVAAFACCYTAGAEVLWRMTGARIPWEAGKYVTSAILLVSIARSSRWRSPVLPFVYFALLIPSILFVITMSDLGRIRRDLSFNLSGPFSLMVVAWFFSRLEIRRSELLCLFKVLVGPVAGIAAIALYTTLTAANLRFGHESLKITSGGFGPNQVSSVLGLGCLLCILHVIEPRLGARRRMLMFLVAVLFAVHSALTFSRSGLYFAGIGTALAVLCTCGNLVRMLRITSVCMAVLAAGYLLIVPQLDASTNGALVKRFADADSTGRDQLFAADLQVWLNHPILGVGPGQSRHAHFKLGHGGALATHSEYARLLAEHGLFGLVSLVILLIMGIRNLCQARTGHAVGLLLPVVAWGHLFLVTNAARLVSPFALIGLTFATFTAERDRS